MSLNLAEIALELAAYKKCEENSLTVGAAEYYIKAFCGIYRDLNHDNKNIGKLSIY